MSQPEPPRSVGPPRLTAGNLWPIAVLGFGVGDLVTTAIGLRLVGAVETNPVVTGLLGGSAIVPMVALKLVVLGGAYAVWWRLPRAPAVGVPLGLAVVGVVVTAWNLHVVLRAVAV